MSQDHRYRPQPMRGGVVAQSGIDLRPRAMQRFNLLDPTKRPFRAVVINTRMIDEPGQVRGRGVECDVILIRTQLAIQNVPVMQQQHGVNNVHTLWTPRPSTRIVGADGEPMNVQRVLSLRGTFVAPASPLGDIDGDQVLVDFIEGNRDYPIIVGALPHSKSNRVLTSGIGWREGSVVERGAPKRDEFYVHHYGAEVRINEQGELLIDTVGAYSDPATEDPNQDVGQVRIRVKERADTAVRFTVAIGDDQDVLEVWKEGGQLRIDLGESADERLVLGDSFRSFLNDFFQNIFDTHTHSTGTGPSGPPLNAPAPQMGVSLLSDLAKTKQS